MMWKEVANKIMCMAWNTVLQVLHRKMGHVFQKLAPKNIDAWLTDHMLANAQNLVELQENVLLF